MTFGTTCSTPRPLADPALTLSGFGAGIMQRKEGDIAVFPYFFSRTVEQGQAVGIEVVRSSADIVQEARILAVREAADEPPPVRPEEHQSQVALVRQGWLARVVSMFKGGKS